MLLPHLIDVMPLVGWIAACGLAYWYRGRGVFAGRPVCAAVWGAPLLFASDDLFTAVSFWVVGIGAGYAGFTPGHGSYFDMGRNEHQDDEQFASVLEKLDIEKGIAYDSAGMILTGLINIAPLLILFALMAGNYLLLTTGLIAATTKPVAYEIGWRIWGLTGKGWGKGKTNPIAIGEMLFGTFAALTITALWWVE